MGRKDYFAQQDEIAKEKRDKQLQKSGYVFGAHADEDSIRDKDKRVPKTKRMYSGAVNLWMKFVEQYGIKGYTMGPGCAIPDHKTIKEFLRWYSHLAQRLFGGFEEKLQIKIVLEDRKEISSWIKRTLTENEGTVENVEDPDHSFTKKDFLRMISSMWQADHRIFMPGLLKAIMTLALQLYLFTGARIGAFIPAHEDRDQRGLRYKHIDLVLFPSSTAPWKVEWKINQVWLKGNRNPDYTVFGIGIRDTKRPQFASGYILLAIALQHGALYGIETVEDFARFDLSSGEPIELRWKEEFLEKPVLRNVTADGPQDVPLHKERFCELLRGIVTTAGYNKSLTVHIIRKYLGSVVEGEDNQSPQTAKRNKFADFSTGKHGSALVSQIYGHKDAGTYPKEYLLHCSSIDTVSAVLGEEEQSSHIEYFQGFERFYERGLPGELPAGIEASILQMPEVVDIRRRIKQLEASNSDKRVTAAEKLNYRKTLIRLRLASLKEYQNRWVREKRDQRILNRGKAELVISENDVSTRAQSLLMPELAHISTLMSSDRELSFDEMLLFVDDLKTHCERDFDVAYLPRESPIQDRCPARDCLKEIKCMKKSDRSAHIHNCVRREMALDLKISEPELKFCYECMEWFQSSQWRDHCSSHIQSWRTQHCEVIVYRNTVIRPGYCPFCLWNIGLEAEDRLHQWLKSGNLKQHIEEKHMPENQESGAEPICGCGQAFADERDLRHHLHDSHKLNKAIWSNPKPPRKRKRPSKAEAQYYSMKQHEQLPKKLRFYRYPPSRLEHDYQLPENTTMPVPTLHSFVEEHPEQFFNSSFSNESTKSSRSSPVASCFSRSSSPCSSDPTTPRFEEFIDPRILEPYTIDENQGTQPCDKASMQPNPLHEHEIKNKLFGDVIRLLPSGQSLAIQPSPDPEISNLRNLNTSDLCAEDVRQSCEQVTSQLSCSPHAMVIKQIQPLYSPPSFVTSKENKKEDLLKESGSYTSHGDGYPSTESGVQNHSPTHQAQTLPRDRTQVTSLRRPLTRSQGKQQSTQHYLDHADETKSRKKLNARDKRKLCDFKSQKKTLRQIGPYFPDIDTVSLRQAWADIRLPDRRTRSRVK
ncbi:hypothetical protein N7530_008683 [Penicillium desertorum]|uniref:Uncharacterized protein n=1 Tax=Penicillium desertorum TaxID=1303715 RepID=A0A9W9WPW4_9EURO|nr:hypothetical protein N7530_008683 [Penicillium desertorum]